MPDQLNNRSYGEGVDSLRELEWTLVRTLLSASASENKALESYFLQRHSRDGDADFDTVHQYLDDALTQHRRAIEDLKLARQVLDEMEAFRSDEGTKEYY